MDGDVLHDFTGDPNDGAIPAANLIFDASGNLYGTTTSGGAFDEGTAFELVPDGAGGLDRRRCYTASTSGGSDGTAPFDGLVFDGSGNLWGTTEGGGTDLDGTVFELSPNGAGAGWRQCYTISPVPERRGEGRSWTG